MFLGCGGVRKPANSLVLKRNFYIDKIRDAVIINRLMKIWIFNFLFLIFITNVFSQTVLEERYQLSVKPFVDAVVNNDREKTADLIYYYPFSRQYPIPPINNKREMIERYDQIFDETLINIIKNSSVETDWQAIGWRGIIFKDGLVWIDYDGSILRINYQSLQEKEIRKNIIREIKYNLHESLREFVEPELLCETDSYIIRVDLLDEHNYIYRLALWHKGKNQNEIPDMVLTDGKLIFSGSGGNRFYIFEYNNYQYILFIDVMSKDYGYFMIYNGTDRDWYDREYSKNVELFENIYKIEQ
jgi:hypothetical protein